MFDTRERSRRYWDDMFKAATRGEPEPFGEDTTYQLAADFIGDLPVEDWGCGLGWYRRFARGGYWGVDGSPSPYADDVVDLRSYRSSTPALLLRRVLEYNPHDWQTIVDNAVASFTRRMVLVMFTRRAHMAFLIKMAESPDVWVDWDEVTDRFGGISYRSDSVLSDNPYGLDRVFYLDKAVTDQS